MKPIKETLIGTMKNGKNILNQIEVSYKVGPDFSLDINSTERTINELHPKRLNLKLIDIKEETKEVKTLRFTSVNGYLPPFEAGQYINVFVEIDGVCTSRPYSISSSPKARGYYEISVGKVANGFVSEYLMNGAKVGDEFETTAPCGPFHYNPVSHSKKSVFLAGGTGITPFMSMTREILETAEDREIWLLYGVRQLDLAVCHKEFTELSKKYPNFHYVPVVSEGEEKGVRHGFLDKACIQEVCGDVLDKTYYILGPSIMMDFVVDALRQLDVKNKNIRCEAFGAPQNITKENGYPQGITGEEVFNVKVGGKTIPAKASETLLTALERSGVRVNVCCRSGECSLCKVKLVKGKVFMPRGVLLREADEKFGYIHSCKAYPISDIEILL